MLEVAKLEVNLLVFTTSRVVTPKILLWSRPTLHGHSDKKSIHQHNNEVEGQQVVKASSAGFEIFLRTLASLFHASKIFECSELPEVDYD